MPSTEIDESPLTTAWMAWPLLLIGTLLNCTPATCPSSTPARCGIEPRDVLPSVTASGLALAIAIASAKDFGPLAGLATNSIGVSATTATGAKSVARSYLLRGRSAA